VRAARTNGMDPEETITNISERGTLFQILPKLKINVMKPILQIL
jgi:hypothetical protein